MLPDKRSSGIKLYMNHFILIIQITVFVSVTLLITQKTGNEATVVCGFVFGMLSLPIRKRFQAQEKSTKKIL